MNNMPSSWYSESKSASPFPVQNISSLSLEDRAFEHIMAGNLGMSLIFQDGQNLSQVQEGLLVYYLKFNNDLVYAIATNPSLLMSDWFKKFKTA
jgi:hypothetical protein